MFPAHKLSAILCLSLSLTACGGGKLGKLKHVEPVGTPFQKALAKEYKSYAEAEDGKYQAFDAQYFADKALRASYGQDTVPEKITKWDVREKSKPALIQARLDLIDLFRTGITSQLPEKSAHTQVLYDCWVEQEEQGVDPYDVFCRDDFYKSMDELTAYIYAKSAEALPKVADNACDTSTGQCGNAAKAETNKTLAYTVYFDFDSARLTAAGETLLQGVIQEVKKLPSYEIVLNGHTDRAGTERYNLQLSKRRALTVKDRLIKGGVRPEFITLFAFGEASPKVPTADGVKNPANRRVEISVQDR